MMFLAVTLHFDFRSGCLDLATVLLLLFNNFAEAAFTGESSLVPFDSPSFAVRLRCRVVGNEIGRLLSIADVELDLLTACICGRSLINPGTDLVDSAWLRVCFLAARISRDLALMKLFLGGADVVCGVDSDRRLLYDSRGELTALVMDDRRLLLAVAIEDGEFSWVEVHDDSVLFLLPNLLLAAELGCRRLLAAGSLLMIGFDREKLDFSANVLLMADGLAIRFDPPNFTSDS